MTVGNAHPGPIVLNPKNCSWLPGGGAAWSAVAVLGVMTSPVGRQPDVLEAVPPQPAASRSSAPTPIDADRIIMLFRSIVANERRNSDQTRCHPRLSAAISQLAKRPTDGRAFLRCGAGAPARGFSRQLSRDLGGCHDEEGDSPTRHLLF
jgi:hypothetical protein